MKSKKLLTILMLLFAGGISAFSLTSYLQGRTVPLAEISPGAGGGTGREETATDKPNLEALTAKFNAVKDSLTNSPNKAFYAGIEETDPYKAANDTLEKKNHYVKQSVIDGMVVNLEKVFRKKPFVYVTGNVDNWYQSYYGSAQAATYTKAEYDSIYGTSDFKQLKNIADSILTNFVDRENLIPDTVLFNGPNRLDTAKHNAIIEGYPGIIKRTGNSKQSAEKLWLTRKSEISEMLATIKNEAAYAEIQSKSIYTLLTSWKWTDSKSANSEVPVYTNPNLTEVVLYYEYLNEEKRFVDLKKIYTTSIDKATADAGYGQEGSYFVEADKDNQDWKDIHDSIAQFQTLLGSSIMDAANKKYNFNKTDYGSLLAMQADMNIWQASMQNIPTRLEAKLTGYRTQLKEKITLAEKLYSRLNTETIRNGLNGAIATAKTLDTIQIFSTVKTATTDLDKAYVTALTHYNNAVDKFKAVIQKAEESNNTWNDGTLATAVSSANEILASAKKVEVMENTLISETAALETVIILAGKRYGLSQNIALLKDYQTLYGDEDKAMQILIDEAGKATTATEMDNVSSKIEAKKKETETLYEQIKKNLESKIAASKNYYQNWLGIKEGIDVLKTAYEKAEGILTQNTTEIKRNIKALTDAFNELSAVYKELGGESDPFEARQRLEELLTQAKASYVKYNYSDLQIAINDAQNKLTSDIKYILEQQIANLTAVMTTTEEQYKLIVGRLDEQYKITENKIAGRYGDNAPTEVQEIMTVVQDSLARVDDEDRACTNIPLLQGYYRNLQSIVTDADAAWNTEVEAFHQEILEAEQKFTTVYPDKEELGEAVENAKQQYTEINTEKYRMIAAVTELRKSLDTALVKVEGTDRRGVADNFMQQYKAIEKNFKIYGSDENTVNTSNAKVYLEKNGELYNYLATAGLNIKYSLAELSEFVTAAKHVMETYQLFCNASQKLGEALETAETDNEKYYGEEQSTPLGKAIKYAKWAKTESYSQDSIEAGNFALRDSLAQTERLYRNTLQAMKTAYRTAKSQHTVYYGSAETSEILEVCAEAEALFEEFRIRTLEDMTVRLAGCYKSAEQKSAALEAQLQELISSSDTLNVLMKDNEFDEIIAKAINARYSTDGRIAAIEEYKNLLQAAYEAQSDKYDEACVALNESLEAARILLAKQADEALEAAIKGGEEVAAKTDKTDPKSSTYSALENATTVLTEAIQTVEQQMASALTDAREALSKAREEALVKHNYFYGTDQTDSEILKVYREAEAFLTSDVLNDIVLMTDSVNNSYVAASVNCAKKEANLDNLTRKSKPLATLMEDADYAKLILVAVDCRNRMEARIVAIDSVYAPLMQLYDDSSTRYDDAVYALGDSIAEANSVLLQLHDKALEAAITVAEEALAAAGKTSAESTKYAELILQTETLAIEIARVRILIANETSIDAVRAEDREVEVYTTQGFLVKRVRLSDSHPFRNIPEGVYIVDGKKVYIHENNK